MVRALKAVKGYYYLVPLWWLLESFLWPGLRAGPVVGSGLWARAGFFALEGLIGAAYWRGLPVADTAAFFENLVCLIGVCRTVLLGPLDIGLNLERDPFMAQAYVASLPGVFYSGFSAVITLKRLLARVARN